jgi:hypothetical protein
MGSSSHSHFDAMKIITNNTYVYKLSAETLRVYQYNFTMFLKIICNRKYYLSILISRRQL